MSDLFQVREEMGLALAHARLPGMGGLTRVNNAMVHEWLETLDKEAQRFRQLSLLLAAVVILADPEALPGGTPLVEVELNRLREAEKGDLRMGATEGGGVRLTWYPSEPLAPPAGTS